MAFDGNFMCTSFKKELMEAKHKRELATAGRTYAREDVHGVFAVHVVLSATLSARDRAGPPRRGRACANKKSDLSPA